VRRSLASFYLILQGLGVAAWWALLWLRPAARAPFLPPHNDPTALLAFAAPDLAFIAVGSLLAGLFLRRGNGWALPLTWLTAGAVDYATVYVLMWSALTGGGWLGFVMMAPTAIVSTTLALDLAAEKLPLFRQAGPASPAWNVVKTLLQIVAFWSFFLALLPTFLVSIEAQMGWARFAFAGQRPLAAALFLALSALGLWSGLTMARRGDGTPLPLDATRRLVLGGPYAYVRNPMAMAGLGQAMAVGLALGSPLVLVYAGLGAAVWNWLVRPSEEADLARNFGEGYQAYCRAVQCWIPRWQPYRGSQG
jgi:protein-S-isoprenylcysteine O-methyltransferase Ste14